jgi:hypothetical protein
VGKIEKKGKKKPTAQIRTNVRARVFNAVYYWLEVSFHSEGSATGQLDQGFPFFFLGPRENAELVSKFRVAMHASHAALPMVTLRISS